MAAEDDDSEELSVNELRFVREFAVDRNTTQAYIRAYSTEDFTPSYFTAANRGKALRNKDKIDKAIKAACAEHAKSCLITAKRTLQSLAMIGYADPWDLYEEDEATGLPKPRRWSSLTPEARRTITSIKIKRKRVKTTSDTYEEIEEIEYKIADKLKSLEQMCKYLGLTGDSNAFNQLLELLRTHPALASNPTSLPLPSAESSKRKSSEEEDNDPSDSELEDVK